MFRDFIYLDTNRIQSVIAQLQQGLLTDLVEGREKEIAGGVDLTTGLLAQLLPIGGSVEGKLNFNAQQNKILHDYAFQLALESLRKAELVIEVDDLEREEDNIFPVPEAAFILASGTASLLDYEILSVVVEQLPGLKALWDESKLDLTSLSSHQVDQLQDGTSRQAQRRERSRQVRNRRQQSKQFAQETRALTVQGAASGVQATRSEADLFLSFLLQAISTSGGLVKRLLGDVIQFNLKTVRDVAYIGDLNREFLREDIRSLIFKYGSTPQGEWTMLAQVSSIPAPGQAQKSWADLTELFTKFDYSKMRSGADFFALVLRAYNSFQEVISSVAYPNIAVAPIAIYREIHSLR